MASTAMPCVAGLTYAACRFVELVCGGRGIVMLRLAATAPGAGAAFREPKSPAPADPPPAAGTALECDPPPPQAERAAAAISVAASRTYLTGVLPGSRRSSP
jgi:hypothetical protein